MKCERPGCENEAHADKLCATCRSAINRDVIDWVRANPKKGAKMSETKDVAALTAGALRTAGRLMADAGDGLTALSTALQAERAAHEATKRELETARKERQSAWDSMRFVEDSAKDQVREHDQLRAEVERLKGELEAVRRERDYGSERETIVTTEVKRLRAELAAKKQPQPEPAKGVEEWRAEKCSDVGWVVTNGTTGGYWALTFGEQSARSIAGAINDSIARGRAEWGDDGRLRAFEEAWRRVVTEGETAYDESQADLNEAQKILAEELTKLKPARYVVKVSGTTKPYDTQADAENKAGMLRQNWGIDAKVERKDEP